MSKKEFWIKKNIFSAYMQILKCAEPYSWNLTRSNLSCLAPTADLDIDRPTAYVVFASNLDR